MSLATADGAARRSFSGERRVARKTPGRLLPHRLGPYELFDHIGKGGMADIYRARRRSDLGVERVVVVKEVLPELVREPRFGDLLVAEAKLAARLSHANIVRVEHLGRDEETLFIAMEYVHGLDLREVLRRAARGRILIPADFAIRIAMDVLAALDHAHRFRFPEVERVGIIHRDVSPSNVLLSFDGEVKLCDFGIARAHDADADVPTSIIEGKAGYMSPEQARGEGLDGRADVFALGIILQELLTGRKLYKATDGQSLLDVALRANIPVPAIDHLPRADELKAIVGRALERNRSQRFATAGEMLAELDGYVSRSGLVASSLKLGEWLSTEFEGEVEGAMHARELAVLALSRGPVARLVVIAPPEPPSTPEPVADVRADAETPPSSFNKIPAKKKRRGKKMASKSRDIDDPPKSLEGTASDVPSEPRRETGAWRYTLIFLALFAVVGIVIVTILVTRH